ncbi:MAG: nitroreductase family protein [Planctomycetota bacterium]
MIKDLVLRNRSFRRFKESHAVTKADLRELVELARYSATGGNKQPLKFMLAADKVRNAHVFPHLQWAASLKDWGGPAEGERPAAYIIVLGDTEISKGFGVDPGIAAQSILLGAAEKGLGGCMIGSIKRDELRKVLSLSLRYDILLVIALGVPGEKVVLEDAPPGDSVTYYRDKESVHHVPKRTLDELIIG